MLQAFVPASSEAGRDGGSKKRRRPVAAGEGEEVSSLYESIVRPGDSSSGKSRSDHRGRSGTLGDEGFRSGASGSPMSSLTLPTPLATESGKRSKGKTRARLAPAAPAAAVFGPVQDPDAAPEESFDADEEEQEEGFFCQVCGERVKSLSEEKHSTSTLHIFNQKHRRQDRKVQIHESNKGFQLLSGMGWRLDEGLGARRQGRVNPLQTTFKRDTTGLGAGGKLRPRVTHFPSHIPSQALNAPDGKSEAVRAHESLDRRRGRRNKDGPGKRHSRDVAGGSEASDEPRRAGGIRGESSSGGGGGGSVDSWGGFWGQGTQPERDRGSSGGASNRGSSSGRRVDGGRGQGGGSGKYGTGFFMSKKEREAEQERELRKARKARFELLSDVPEEYAALFTG